MENTDDQNQHSHATHRAIEQAVRDSYGRLLALLAARSGDLCSTELWPREYWCLYVIAPYRSDKRYKVISVQNPTTSLEDDVAATKRAVDRADGDVVLVGHSWGGSVITEAALIRGSRPWYISRHSHRIKAKPQVRWARALLRQSFQVSFRMQTVT